MSKKQIYRINTRTVIRMGNKGPLYRRSAEDFTNYEKALKKYNRMIDLHSPEWDISIGNISSGLFNAIIDCNKFDHIVWLYEEHGYHSDGYNLETIKMRQADKLYQTA